MTEKKIPKGRPDGAAAARGAGWFDNLTDLRKDLVCAGLLLLVVYVLFWKVISSDLDLAAPGGDFVATHNWKNAISHIEKNEGFKPLWIPFVYGGMPVASTLLFPEDYNWIEGLLTGGIGLERWSISIATILFGSGEVHYFLFHIFLGGLFAYMLARSLKLPHLGALLAGFVFLLNPYAVGLGESFHWSKLAVFSYIPLLFLLVRRLMERRDLLTLGLLSATIGTMFLNRHPQIAFYGMLLVGAYFLYEFIADIKHSPGKYAHAGALLAAAVVLGLAVYAYEMLPTKEYAEYSVRGGGGDGAVGGASYEWATNWSLHPWEMITYIVPSWFGFGAQVGLEWKGQEIVLPGYWGWMPSTDNPPYIGIVPVILAVFALVYRRNRMTWFLAGFSLFAFFLSFGRFLPILYDLFYHYFPYFNKFRAPSLILFLIPLTVGLLGVYGLSWVIDARGKGAAGGGVAGADKRILPWLYGAAGLFILAFLGKQAIFEFFPPSAFTREGDPFNAQMVPVVREIRFHLLWADVLKVSGIAVVTLGLIVAYLRRKIGATAMSFGIVALLVVDLAVIDRQFIHPRPKTDLQASLKPDATMEFLKTDTTTFRVLALEQNLFRDNTLMNNFQQSVTGYSPAKLRIYQEMFDSALIRPVDPTMPVNMNVVAMMNTKYVISPSPLPPDRFQQVYYDPATKLLTYQYSRALRRAWFVDSVAAVGSKSEMYAMMNSPEWKPNEVAILNEPAPAGISPQDSSWVRLTSYGAHTIVLRAYTSAPALLVLSDVYYPAGWTATVDGAETKIYRTNAVLRSVVVPAGEHEVRFVFNPDSFRTGSTVSLIGWVLVLTILVVGGYRDEAVKRLFRKRG